jgi:hypothetical protein
MPFIEELLNYGTLSIVGLEKNTGKTECLNYVLKRVPLERVKVGVSSIGIDGERIDQITLTPKPEIFLREGMLFTTTEKHYRERRVLSEILDISSESTSMGRLVTARALKGGKVLLSGPPTTSSLIKWTELLKNRFKADLCIIDGALSRLSLATPALSDAMILATGAALSISIRELIERTAFVVELINLPEADIKNREEMLTVESGVWRVNKFGDIIEPVSDSAFKFDINTELQLEEEDSVYIAGALTDRFLKMISSDKKLNGKSIIVKDFTRFFIHPLTYRNYLKKGGLLTVLQKSKLIAVCANPISPNGFKFDSIELCDTLSQRLNLPVYDILRDEY